MAQNFHKTPQTHLIRGSLVELLEDKKTFTCYSSDKNQYQTFCEAYTIELLERYVQNPDVLEPMLASYQLLDDYDQLKFIRDRHMRYSERASDTNRLISKAWADPNDSLQNIEDKAISKLVDRLTEEAINNKENPGFLGLASVVVGQLKKLFPNELPKKLPLPKPRYKEQNTNEAPTSHEQNVEAEEPDKESPPSKPKPSKLHISRDINNGIIIQLRGIDIRLQWLVWPASVVLLVIVVAVGFFIYTCLSHSSDESSIQNNVLVPGEIHQVVIVMPSGESVEGLLKYISSDPGLLTVSSDGFVLAHEGQPGETRRTAEITVQDENGVIATKPFTVDFTGDSYDPPVEDIDDFVPEFFIIQKVRLVGTSEWTTSVNAEIGDKVEFRLTYINNGLTNATQRDVMIRSILPSNLRYVPGSTLLFSTKYPNGATINKDTVVTDGIDIGNYLPDSNAYVRFTAEVVDDNLADGSNTLVLWGQGGVGHVTLQDYAAVVVQK